MAYNSRSSFKASAIAAFVSGVTKWSGAALQNLIIAIADSLSWESQKTIMGSSTYDCTVGNLQEYTLTANATLNITNAEAGKAYTLIKKGAFTLTLPASQLTASTNVVPSGTAQVTFLYDGTNYWFNFSSYSAT